MKNGENGTYCMATLGRKMLIRCVKKGIIRAYDMRTYVSAIMNIWCTERKFSNS
ncbi:hypothetical protein [Zhurongbacter thermophilus]